MSDITSSHNYLYALHVELGINWVRSGPWEGGLVKEGNISSTERVGIKFPFLKMLFILATATEKNNWKRIKKASLKYQVCELYSLYILVIGLVKLRILVRYLQIFMSNFPGPEFAVTKKVSRPLSNI